MQLKHPAGTNAVMCVYVDGCEFANRTLHGESQINVPLGKNAAQSTFAEPRGNVRDEFFPKYVLDRSMLLEGKVVQIMFSGVAACDIGSVASHEYRIYNCDTHTLAHLYE